jgi:hypothetical protein
MRCWVIILPNLSVNAMAIYPFILLKNKNQKQDVELINHEKIHHRQQLELLLLGFYFLYLVNYLFNLLKYKNHYQAYYNISFEKEAYKHEKELNYLTNRKWYNWINFYSV